MFPLYCLAIDQNRRMLLFDNPTQATGFAVFLVTFICCWLPGRGGGWRWLAAIYLVLAGEMLLEGRHGLRLFVNDLMQQSGLYSARGGYQLVIAGLAIVVLLFAIHQIMQRGIWTQVSQPGKWAWLTTLGLLMFFAVEFLSVHALDALLYQTSGGLMRIAWVWLFLAGITAASAIIQARQSAGD